MSPETFVLLSGMLTFGVPLAWAVWELLQLRRLRDEDGGRGRGPDRPPSPPGTKPLPDCLIPRPAPARPRILEDA